MAEENFPDFAAIAQEAAKDLLIGLDIERNIVTKEHDLKLKLMVWDNIIEHLNTLVAENSGTHKLLLSVVDKLTELRNIIDSYEIKELKLVAEEKGIVKQLETDLLHRKWRLVRIEEQASKSKAKNFEKLEIKELAKLRKKFFELGLLIEKSKAINIELADTRKSPEEFKKEEEYYFLQIYKFATAYVDVLGDLVTKENMLLEKLT